MGTIPLKDLDVEVRDIILGPRGRISEDYRGGLVVFCLKADCMKKANDNL